MERTEEKLRAGVTGWLAGLTLGAPVSGKNEWRNLTFYTPVPNSMAPSEAVDLSVAHLSSMSQSDLARSPHLGTEPPKAPASDCSRIYRENLLYGEGAAAFAIANLRRGFNSPMSGFWQNPFAHDAGAMGRAPFWGLVYFGNPGEAAAACWEDASVDHSGLGVWAASFWAAAISTAGVASSISECLRTASRIVPSSSPLLEAFSKIVQMRTSEQPWQEARQHALLIHRDPDPRSAFAGFCFALIGAVYGDADFQTTAITAAGCGGPAAEASACALSLVAAGVGHIPEAWTKPLGSSLVTTAALRPDSPPQTIERFASEIAELNARLVQRQEPEPEPQTDDVEDDVVVLPPEPVIETAAIDPYKSRSFEESAMTLSDARVRIRYPDGAAAVPGGGRSLVFYVDNLTAEPKEIEPEITVPAGYECAHRAQRLRIEPHGSVHIPAVVKAPPAPAAVAELGFDVLGAHLQAPLLRPQVWWSAGPFPNQEQMGYEQAYRPETNLERDEVMSGRSSLVVKWEERHFPGVEMDLEPLFVDAPAVVYLAAELRFAEPGRYRMVLASPVGHIVWVDGEKVKWYQDTHKPVPRPVHPYVIEFASSGWTRFLVKSLRNQAPVVPTYLYFLDSLGAVVWPEKSRFPEP